VDTLGAAGGLARRLHGGEQESDQHGDDRDDDQQLDQCEAGPEMSTSHGMRLPTRCRKQLHCGTPAIHTLTLGKLSMSKARNCGSPAISPLAQRIRESEYQPVRAKS